MDAPRHSMKVGMSNDRFMIVGVVCIILAVALCLAAISYFEEPPPQNPYGITVGE